MAQQTIIDEFRLAAPIRFLNRLGSLLGSLHGSPAHLQPEAVIADAVRRTGFPDWGETAFLDDYKTCFRPLNFKFN